MKRVVHSVFYLFFVFCFFIIVTLQIIMSQMTALSYALSISDFEQVLLVK